MIVLWFAGLAILIFALWQASVWVQNWQIKRNEEKQHRRRQHYYEHDPNIKKRDPFAIRAHVQAIADQLQGYREQQERSERRSAARENLTIVGIFITAALALGQGWIFYNQLNEMQEDRRAWVGPYQAGFEGTLMPNMPIAVHVQYQNTGREPALDAFYDLEHFTVNIADDQAGVTVRRIATYAGRCFATPPRKGCFVVFPTTGFSNYTTTREISREEVDYDVIYGLKYLVVTGCFAYNTLGRVHRTSFCFFFQNGNSRMTNSAWAFCPTGNYAR